MMVSLGKSDVVGVGLIDRLSQSSQLIAPSASMPQPSENSYYHGDNQSCCGSADNALQRYVHLPPSIMALEALAADYSSPLSFGGLSTACTSAIGSTSSGSNTE